jgi:hypothetical protein
MSKFCQFEIKIEKKQVNGIRKHYSAREISPKPRGTTIDIPNTKTYLEMSANMN